MFLELTAMVVCFKQFYLSNVVAHFKKVCRVELMVLSENNTNCILFYLQIYISLDHIHHNLFKSVHQAFFIMTNNNNKSPNSVDNQLPINIPLELLSSDTVVTKDHPNYHKGRFISNGTTRQA